MADTFDSPNVTPTATAVMRTLGPLIREHALWEPGERLAIGLSGGKDSLTLTWLLSEATRFHLPECHIVALHVPPPPWCSCAVPVEELRRLAASLPRVELQILASDEPLPESCDRCARERRRRLFLACREREIHTLAFAHHQDDLVQTLLMNILFHGEASATMQPVRSFGDGALRLIRPLLSTPEKRIIALARRLGYLRSVTCATSGPAESQRTAVRAFLHGLGPRRDVVKANLARLARQFRSAESSTPASEPASPSK